MSLFLYTKWHFQWGQTKESKSDFLKFFKRRSSELYKDNVTPFNYIFLNETHLQSHFSKQDTPTFLPQLLYSYLTFSFLPTSASQWRLYVYFYTLTILQFSRVQVAEASRPSPEGRLMLSARGWVWLRTLALSNEVQNGHSLDQSPRVAGLQARAPVSLVSKTKVPSSHHTHQTAVPPPSWLWC